MSWVFILGFKLHLIVGLATYEKKHICNEFSPNSYFICVFVGVICYFDATIIVTCTWNEEVILATRIETID
jgi:hypothetical protein